MENMIHLASSSGILDILLLAKSNYCMVDIM